MSEDEQINNDIDLGYTIDTKTEKSLIKRIVNKSLEKALHDPLPPPPSQTDIIMKSVTEKISEKVANTMLSGLDGGQKSGGGIIYDFMNSTMGAQIGANFMNQLPATIESLGKVLGQQKAQALSDAAINLMNQKQQDQQNQQMKQQQDAILALDSNNPQDIIKYSGAMGMSEIIAKTVLEAHQQDIKKQRESKQPIEASQPAPTQLPQQSVTQPPQPTQPQQPQPQQEQQPSQQEQIIQVMIEEMKLMKEHIAKLEADKIEKVNATVHETTRDKWEDDDLAPGFMGTPIKQPDAKLFNSVVKVDVDEISGDTNSFFKEPEPVKEEQPKVSVTKQPIKMVHMKDELKQDKDGNITIVGNEKPKIEEKKDTEEIIEDKKEIIDDKKIDETKSEEIVEEVKEEDKPKKPIKRIIK